MFSASVIFLGKTVVFLSEKFFSVLLFMSDVVCLKQMKSLDMSIASVIEQGSQMRLDDIKNVENFRHVCEN
jgi:hypothetical protein